MRVLIRAVLVGVATFLVSFILTNVAYLEWAEWRYPDTSSMAGLGAVVLSLMVAPVCGLASSFVYLKIHAPRRET